jgi:hypothetical protein
VFLQEAVQICRGTSWRFRRPTWAEGVWVRIEPDLEPRPTPCNGSQLTDMVFTGPSSVDGGAFNIDSDDVLADDYEVAA